VNSGNAIRTPKCKLIFDLLDNQSQGNPPLFRFQTDEFLLGTSHKRTRAEQNTQVSEELAWKYLIGGPCNAPIQPPPIFTQRTLDNSHILLPLESTDQIVSYAQPPYFTPSPPQPQPATQEPIRYSLDNICDGLGIDTEVREHMSNTDKQVEDIVAKHFEKKKNPCYLLRLSSKNEKGDSYNLAAHPFHFALISMKQGKVHTTSTRMCVSAYGNYFRIRICPSNQKKHSLQDCILTQPPDDNWYSQLDPLIKKHLGENAEVAQKYHPIDED
jgi:hypothetical protein